MLERNILVYISENCDECVETISFLDKYDINYKVKNISENKKYMKELQQQKVYATPAIFINNKKVLLGFQENRLRNELGLI